MEKLGQFLPEINSGAVLSLAVLAATTLSACGVSSNGKAARNLPAASSAGDLFRTVDTPPVNEGDDAREKLAETRGALSIANMRIMGAASWYETIRSKYASGGA